MPNRRSFALAALSLSLSSVLAGPLDPPAGPIGPTLKPLSDVEPRIALGVATTPGDADSVYRITEPGSYYLTGDVVGAPGKTGIEVAPTTGVVSIDLRGFAVRGVPGALGGITGPGGAIVRVRNGTVSGWPGVGLQASQVEWVNVTNNGGTGIVATENPLISHCSVSFNGLTAGGYGIAAGPRAVVSDCSIHTNGGSTGGGISLGASSRISRCSVVNNATSLGVSGSGYGIATAANCQIADCRVDFNGAPISSMSGGILAGDGTRVSGCTLTDNWEVGIWATGASVILENSVSNTAGFGMIVTGSRGRIDSNHVTGNTVGLRVDGTGNTVVRNSARANTTQYAVLAGNDAGPIGTAAAATSPWANIAN